jgi:hypothetical protein
LEDPQSRAEKLWKSSALGYVLCAISFAAACWALYSTPLPGISIAILGAVAAVMSLRPDMRPPEKALWMIVVGVLLASEMRAIRADRKNADTQSLKDRKEQDSAFSAIRQREDQSLNKTLEGFKAQSDSTNAILEKTQKITDLSERNLENITGGKSFLILRAAGIKNGYFIPSIESSGSSIVRKAHVRVVNLALFALDAKVATSAAEVFAHDINIEIGDMAPREQAVNFQTRIPIGSGNSAAFNIFFSGLNGFWTEELRLRKKGNDWLQAIRVFRTPSGVKTSTILDPLYDHIDDGYLNKDEKIDWDKNDDPRGVGGQPSPR